MVLPPGLVDGLTTHGIDDVGSYVALAIERLLRRDGLLRLLDELDEEFGPVDEETSRAVDDTWRTVWGRS